MTVSVGDEVHGGHIIAEVPETAAIVHKCMVPPNISGMITKVVPDGEYTIDEPLVTVELESGKDVYKRQILHLGHHVAKKTTSTGCFSLKI